MMPMFIRLAVLSTVVLLMGGPRPAAGAQQAHAEHPATLTVAAANSLRDALKEILPLFEAQNRDVTVRVVYGPSQSLREQIVQGAPVDVFLPSSLEEIEALDKKGLTIGSPTLYGTTALVLITGNTAPAPVSVIQDLRKKEVRRIAIGDPKTSSVGKFAAEFLANTQLDGDLRSRYIYGEHSGAVLDLVAKGEADVGLVYRTDAARSRKVRIIAETPANSHHPVVYGLVAVWTARDVALTRTFSAFMMSAPVQALLREHGFDEAKGSVKIRQR